MGGGGGAGRGVRKMWIKHSDLVSSTPSQAAFCVGFLEDLRRGFPNCSAYWRAIVVFGAKQRKTEPAWRRRVEGLLGLDKFCS